jgi:hypothetical protein
MVEKVKYEIITRINDIEFRKYPEIILAVVEGDNDNNEFSILFNYISGNNKTQKKIEMTAPVITHDNRPEKIKMTAPVITQSNYMAFVMPSAYNKDTIPIPVNPKVKIKVQPERTLAVFRFSGYSTKNKIDSNREKLLKELKAHDIKSVGEPILMRYNSPFAPGFIRRNEIAVEVLYK